ncbi:hypothetical protein HK107_15410 [Parvularcula sp. ZS-1/3]|uniref:ParB/Sulfiredoxin domain-containing protein n=1 Tax=Parvularcula mediterranea TaxID=2732508 RepID=A0A7Y3RP91_9PROT|nr:hypothetical protein [Parvularcula mediterranea]NNU17718.1 hypothetical protein [Parvularcula mediterranea]
MEIKDIPLAALRVNRANDRHGPVADEPTAIEWLLENFASAMRKLAKDISEQGAVYEPPLVMEEDGVYVVYDGNRRTTTLKLLVSPQLAPTRQWADFYEKVRQTFAGELPRSLSCWVETDKARLDEILYRRHNGSQGGVGQAAWDDRAKSNFQHRTGKKSSVDVAEQIERLLADAGRLPDVTAIPRSNLRRLLSAEVYRRRVGVTVKDRKLVFCRAPEKALAALERIASDLISKKITLDDIWDADAKTKYLDSLDSQGVLPTAEDILPEVSTLVASNSKQAGGGSEAKGSDGSTNAENEGNSEPENDQGGGVKIKPSSPRHERWTLIRAVDLGIEETTSNRRALDIINELQHNLFFGQHDNAIAVLFRVLIEISTDTYAKEVGLDLRWNDKLSNRYSKVLTELRERRALERKYAEFIKKFEGSEPLLSAHTFNAYVHDEKVFPSPDHLKTMWDTLQTYVVACLSYRAP